MKNTLKLFLLLALPFLLYSCRTADERNARTIITVWGDTPNLSDYANRDWDGLVETFYKVRWQMFFDAVLAAFDAGQPFDSHLLDQAIRQFECRWAQLD